MEHAWSSGPQTRSVKPGPPALRDPPATVFQLKSLQVIAGAQAEHHACHELLLHFFRLCGPQDLQHSTTLRLHELCSKSGCHVKQFVKIYQKIQMMKVERERERQTVRQYCVQ